MATAQPDDVLRYGAVVPAPTEARVLSRIPWSGLVPLLLCAGTIALTFRSGGFFAGDTALAVVVLGLALVLWVTLVNRPFEALTAPLAIAIAALVLFAAWALLSQSWSHSPSRAVIESDRTLLYVLAVILFGLASASRVVRSAMPRVMPLAFVVVSICGLITRLLPDVWGISNSVAFERLSYPISYWNAQGMIAALAIVSALHLAASGREHRVIRALAAASVAPAACALLLTFSRGAIAVLPVGIIAYLLLARPARSASALVAIVPTTTVAVALTYRSDALVNAVAPDPTMISQGKSVAIVVVACAVAAAVLVLALASLDARVARRRRMRRSQARVVAAGLGLAAVVAALALSLPQRGADLVDRLARVEQVSPSGNTRQHLTSISGSGRGDQYQVALHAFDDRPLIGSGAGTYPLLYAQHRKTYQVVNDGHSLYLETMAEMGIVGLVLVLAAIVSLLAGTLLRRRGDREIAGVAFALTLMWALRAGIDWDWEMPALTLPVLAFAASALYVPKDSSEGSRHSGPNGLLRLLIGLVLLGGMLTPLAIARSQAHLNSAAADLHGGRCGSAITQALAATSALSARPEPFQILAVCDLHGGRGDLALNAINAAVRRDPDNWRLLYDRAIVGATVGVDPRPDLRTAAVRNPKSDFVQRTRERFASSSPKIWRARALKSVLLD